MSINKALIDVSNFILKYSPPGSLQCTFMDVGPSVGGGEGRRFDSSLVTKALRSLITSIQHRNNSLNIYNSAVLPRDSQPDIR